MPGTPSISSVLVGAVPPLTTLIAVTPVRPAGDTLNASEPVPEFRVRVANPEKSEGAVVDGDHIGTGRRL